MLSDINLYWHNYRYMAYEKELAHREVINLLKPYDILSTKGGLRVTGKISDESLYRLVYFREFQANDVVHPTLQNILEKSVATNGTHNKQSTRYSVHGLHEYKGKFNPQIVRSILNILDASPTAVVFDPFCGSGTTLVECTHVKNNAVGCDINPLAVLISNAKLQALTVPANNLSSCFQNILKHYSATILKWNKEEKETERVKYLQSWFYPEILKQIECLKASVLDNTIEWQNIFFVLISDLLREYSLQEPKDLRIRRRYSPMPTRPIIEAIQKKGEQFFKNLEATQNVIGVNNIESHAYITDSRIIGDNPMGWNFQPLYDVAITSPPYVTALPYIDMQRLSIIWLGLCKPSEIGITEARLTGSREYANGEQKNWSESLARNDHHLPEDVYEYCLILKKAISSNDGFRRVAVPSLLYRYLSDMQKVFYNVINIVKKGSPFALVVGHNHTILGGMRFDIDTPNLLKRIAENCGWTHHESIILQTYQRYGIHMTNAVRSEELLILRKP